MAWLLGCYRTSVIVGQSCQPNVTVFRKTNRSARKSISTRGNTRSSMKTLMKIKKKKSSLLVDGASDWLQIRTAASSFDIKGNKAIKKKFVFLANRLVFLNTVTKCVILHKCNINSVEVCIKS